MADIPHKAGIKSSSLDAACEALPLAAAPTFALMALLTWISGSDAPAMLCSVTHGASALCGMVPMYLLMSAFHSAPWLKLIARRMERRSGLARPARSL